MKTEMVVVSIALLMGGPFAQDPSLEFSPRPLKASTTRLLQIPGFGAFGEPQCDSNLSMYYHLAGASYGRTAILRISASGEESKTFTLPDELAKSTAFMDFSVTPGGNVTALVEDYDEHTLALSFDSDGKVSDNVRLDLPKHVAGEHIAVFPKGTMLISGHYVPDADAELRGKGYVALFQSSGKILKKLDKANDDNSPDQQGAASLRDGGVTVAEDGNSYLLSSDRVLAISPSGQVRRTLTFKRPETGFAAVRVEYSQGLLVISFAKPGKPEILYKYLVMNSADGQVLGLFEPSEETGNDNVCFSRNDGFLFMKVENNRVKLITAPLR